MQFVGNASSCVCGYVTVGLEPCDLHRPQSVNDLITAELFFKLHFLKISEQDKRQETCGEMSSYPVVTT